ncbi:MAG: ABC transporter permease [Rhodospirillaceae bacterium]|jgi:peptide/nickel transport system permease protein|nr:ABC transporter permease [Rhodospirillaceae bacterium]MBT4085494.1 ABC transporter permease [Alphaproteobacteria bacterium]MBT4691685.1 ABC transporter permease [Rhodospirillaceae bacterium]MBT6218546.1 ABC transporter permease [Rhodospirillaceae bacterium]MBT6588687.1 ABC transporter permease [Rhodospirillaceae bacterium]
MANFSIIAAKRILNAAALILAVVILNFLLIHIAPGDIVDTIAGEMGGISPELIAEIRADYGLDRPLYEQLALYILKILRGDLGHSFFYDVPVVDLILDALPQTLLLVITALSLALVIGTIFGVIAARRPNSAFSHFITVLSLIGFSAPVFWTGLMFLIAFASFIPLFPPAGMADLGLESGSLDYYLDVLHHMVLPVVTLALIYLAFYSRLSRASMLDVLGSDYVRTARAKGLSERVVVYKHALRNALIPIVTIAGLQFAQILSGAVLVEAVFAWPGLGTLALEAILRRDGPTILGILFFSAMVVVIFNLLTDLTYNLIDPRIRLGSKE